MRRLLILFAVSLFLFGCVQNNPANPLAGAGTNTSITSANNGGAMANGGAASGGYAQGTGANASDPYADSGDYTYVPELYFWASENLPEAVLGVPYNYSFCNPEPAGANDLCGSPNDSSNPSNGHFPYHFTLDSGAGFPPLGLTLGLNGLLTGTPTAIGTNAFTVCAVDLGGKQACANVSLTVKKPVELTVHFIGSGHGKVRVMSDDGNITCEQECTVPFSTKYSSAALSFSPDDGSAFGGWSDGCSSYTPCHVYMGGEDKSVTADFEKFGLKVNSATCSYVPHGGYDYQIRVSATADGPKDSYLSMDMAHYNGFLDNVNDCGSWKEEGNGAYCANRGDAGTTHWSTGFNMGSPREDRTHPFDWNPSLTLAVGYGSSYNDEPDVPKGARIVVPLAIHCD